MKTTSSLFVTNDISCQKREGEKKTLKELFVDAFRAMHVSSSCVKTDLSILSLIVTVKVNLLIF